MNTGVCYLAGGVYPAIPAAHHGISAPEQAGGLWGSGGEQSSVGSYLYLYLYLFLLAPNRLLQLVYMYVCVYEFM